jgi:hypothetical protein
MQPIEVGAYRIRQAGASLNEPRIETAPGDGAVEEGKHRNEIER